MNQRIKLLVIACNTASSVSTEKLKERCKIPVVEVITPGARGAAEITENGKIGVIGTEATVRSGTYLHAIKTFKPHLNVYLKACPLFVPLVEEGWTAEDNEVSLMVADKYLQELRDKEIDTLVLGCTHYPLLKGVIKKVMGRHIRLIDSAQETAKEVMKILRERNLMNENKKEGSLQFFVTDDPERFKKMSYRFLGIEIEDVKQVETIT